MVLPRSNGALHLPRRRSSSKHVSLARDDVIVFSAKTMSSQLARRLFVLSHGRSNQTRAESMHLAQ